MKDVLHKNIKFNQNLKLKSFTNAISKKLNFIDFPFKPNKLQKAFLSFKKKFQLNSLVK